jgi:hypothetical protein
VFYGLTFGKAKSEAWISAMMISFWQDVLVSQPLKVFAAATLFAVLTKDPKKATGEDQEETLPSPELQEDEEFTGQSMEGRGMSLFASFSRSCSVNSVFHAERNVSLSCDLSDGNN